MVDMDAVGRGVFVLVGAVAVAVLGWFVFVIVPDDLADLLGVVLVVSVVLVGSRFSGRLAERVFPSYNVAEVAVDGPITRDGGGGPLPTMPGSTPVDDIVEQIERADEDAAVDALVVKLNTPGGEVVPSDDIRNAAIEFEGPTLAYTNDVCASGGYWIASGCDEIWARDASIVGSIGVIGSRVNAAELAEKLGLSYERLTAGDFKDAGVPLKEMTDDEREYLQGLIDGLYDDFVDRVVESRDLEADAVRETEARVYLGEQALELGLVDHLGDKDDLEDALGGELGVPVSIRSFTPTRSFADRLRGGGAAVAYAFGAGVASTLGVDDDISIELR